MAKKPAYLAQLDKFIKKVKETYKLTTTSKSLRSIGKEMCLMIKERSRKGYGVDANETPQRRFKALSPSYIEMRSNARGLSFYTSPRKSNITFSGEMLDSLDVVQTVKETVTIAPTGRRPGGEYNSVVARYVSETRPFMYLSKTQSVQLNRFYRKLFGKASKSKRLTLTQRL